jgi:transposase
MAIPKNIAVVQSQEELRRVLKNVSPFIAPRIKMLIEMKKHQECGISKRLLAEQIGVNHNSIQSWRTMYAQGGLSRLCSHNKKGFRPSVFTKEEHNLIEDKLNDPKNGLRGYTELLEWIERQFSKEIKYNTMLKYCMRNFGSSVKVARKSHVKKDGQAVDAFKKTSQKPVEKP